MSRANHSDGEGCVERDTHGADHGGADRTNNIRKLQGPTQQKSAQSADEKNGSSEQGENDPEAVMYGTVNNADAISCKQREDAQDEVCRHLIESVARILRCPILRERKGQ